MKTVAELRKQIEMYRQNMKIAQKFVDLVMKAYDLRKTLLNRAGGNGMGRDYNLLSSCRQGPKILQGDRCQSCLNCAEQHKNLKDEFQQSIWSCEEEIKRIEHSEEMGAWAQKIHKALHGGEVEAACEAHTVSHENEVPAWYMAEEGAK